MAGIKIRECVRCDKCGVAYLVTEYHDCEEVKRLERLNANRGFSVQSAEHATSWEKH